MRRLVDDTIAWLHGQGLAAPAAQLQLDSRAVRAGDVFVAVRGGRHDGRDFLPAVAAQGAAAAVVEAHGFGGTDLALPVHPVPGLQRLLGPLAAQWYGDPSAALTSVAVTGTNGKTSCTHWIAQVFAHAGRSCAVVGTVGIGLPGRDWIDAALTTPDAVALQRELARLRAAGADALAIEVSSIGLDQGRVQGMHFDVALFTNLTRDHLDYHGTMERYEAAKAQLFTWPGLRHAVINIDDAAGVRMAQRAAAGGVQVTATSVDGRPWAGACLRAQRVSATRDGMHFELVTDGRAHAVDVPLVGGYNVANLLGVTGVGLACGLALADVVAALPLLAPPPGRMQRVTAPDAPLAVIDYAHTPDALQQALAALRPVVQARGGRLWVVFGAGGDRDPGKRAPMGAAAALGADRMVVTSDNPRSEDPQAIAAMVAAGARAALAACADATGARREVLVVVDRAAAIAQTLLAAAPVDVVLIAGKGHEPYQEVHGVRRPFSDVEHAQAALAARAAEAAC